MDLQWNYNGYRNDVDDSVVMMMVVMGWRQHGMVMGWHAYGVPPQGHSLQHPSNVML